MQILFYFLSDLKVVELLLFLQIVETKIVNYL